MRLQDQLQALAERRESLENQHAEHLKTSFVTSDKFQDWRKQGQELLRAIHVIREEGVKIIADFLGGEPAGPTRAFPISQLIPKPIEGVYFWDNEAELLKLGQTVNALTPVRAWDWILRVKKGQVRLARPLALVAHIVHPPSPVYHRKYQGLMIQRLALRSWMDRRATFFLFMDADAPQWEKLEPLFVAEDSD